MFVPSLVPLSALVPSHRGHGHGHQTCCDRRGHHGYAHAKSRERKRCERGRERQCPSYRLAKKGAGREDPQDKNPRTQEPYPYPYHPTKEALLGRTNKKTRARSEEQGKKEKKNR
jgi:hypothetical protein